MAKKYTELANVRLYWDEKEDIIRLTSSDPRFLHKEYPIVGSRAFTMRLSPLSQVDKMAREILIEDGVDMSSSNPEATREREVRIKEASHYKNRPVRPVNNDPTKLILGYNLETQRPVSWTIPDLYMGERRALGIYGRCVSGKTVLLMQIMEQLVQFPEIYEVVFWGGKGSFPDYSPITDSSVLMDALGKQFTVVNTIEELENLPVTDKQRVIIIDDLTNARIRSGVGEGCVFPLLQNARNDGHIVIFTSHHITLEERHYYDSVVILGKSIPTFRLLAGIDPDVIQYSKDQGFFSKVSEDENPDRITQDMWQYQYVTK